VGKRAAIIIVCIFAAAVLCACEARTRYRVLSFFFDGVPNPDQTITKTKRKKGGTDGSGEIKKGRSEHGPYAAGLCEGCHQRSTNKLLMPAEKLCSYCHTVKSEKKRVHGPMASGGCRICHEPHSSPNRFLLVSESKEFCLYCHDKKEIASREAHKDLSAECTECHDAHGSDNEFLLK